MGESNLSLTHMNPKEAIIVIGLVVVIAIIIFLYGTTIWAIDRFQGKKCPVCGVRGFYKKDDLLGSICGNCERIKALNSKPEDDWLEKLRDNAEKVPPVHTNPDLTDYPYAGSKNPYKQGLDARRRKRV